MTINGEPTGSDVVGESVEEETGDSLNAALAAGREQGVVGGVPGGLEVQPLTDQDIAERKLENSLNDSLVNIEDLAISCQDVLDDPTAQMIGTLVDDLSKCPGEQIPAYIQRNTETIRAIQSELSDLAKGSGNTEVVDLNTAISELLNQG